MSASRSVDLPSCITELLLDGFPSNLILGTYMKICPENPKLVKIGQKCGTLFVRHRHVLFLPVTLDCHKKLPSLAMVSVF
jgi:hypothetical protein